MANSPHTPRRAMLLASTLAGGAAFLVALSIGGPHTPFEALAFALDRLALGGGLAALYLLAAVGLGRLASPLFAASPQALPLQSGVGLAILLSLSHALGWAGLLGGHTGNFVALGVVAVGVALAFDQARRALRGSGVELRLSWSGALIAAGVGLLLAAAAMPPGWLWSSEFGGYDALSYHLALPQEWLASGRLAPLRHNVYSFLPSYFEAAYLHLGAMSFASAPDGVQPAGLIAGEGRRLYACQFLHASCALLAGWLSSRAARAAAARAGADELASRDAGSLAAGLITLTPWCVVTGSLAYNDMAMAALLAASLLAAIDPALAPARRGVLLGLLVGGAGCVKPTALTLAGPALLVVLALTTPRASWPRLALAGLLATLAMLAPWLARNALASGNPVFPFAASLFSNVLGGTGHWDAAQVDRYSAAHRFAGDLADRLRLVVFHDPLDPAGPRHRGLMHPQWGMLFPMALAAILAVLARPATRRAGGALALALVVGLISWLFTTHVQSRFLIPLEPLAAALAGLALAVTPTRRLRVGMGLLVLAVQGVLLARLYLAEGGGRPAASLVAGVESRTGAGVLLPAGAPLTQGQRAWLEQAPPWAFVNARLPAHARVLMVGGATPLFAARPLRYNTTWDAWPLGAAIEAHPDDPAAWTRALRDAGNDFALVELGEVERLSRSGWCDPRVTTPAVARWLREGVTPVRAWDQSGVYLVSLAAPDAPRPAPTPAGTRAK